MKRDTIDWITKGKQMSVYVDDVMQYLDELSIREQRVLCLRLGLNGESLHTFGEIAEEFGVTKERIHQVEKKSLMKILRWKESRESEGQCRSTGGSVLNAAQR